MKIDIIGDCMLDISHQVTCDRLSPEHPSLPIMLSTGQPTYRPGGAANVAYQLRELAEVRLFGLVDAEAAAVYRSHGLEVIGPAVGMCPRKVRFYAGTTAVARWDIEQPSGCALEAALDALRATQASLPTPDILILSDYGKGIFDRFTMPQGVPTIVDPKRLPLDRWKGCTVFKPNAVEAAQLSGMDNWRAQCDFFKEKLGCEAVVITRADEGICGLDASGHWEFCYKAERVLNTVGAGDFFVGRLALAMAEGLSVRAAAELAHVKSNLYVGKPYCCRWPTHPAENLNWRHYYKL